MTFSGGFGRVFRPVFDLGLTARNGLLNNLLAHWSLEAASGALTVTQASGRIDVYLTDEATALLGAATGLGWDVKFIDAAGDSTGWRGTAEIALTETKTV